MRVERSVTSISWIPSEAMKGPMRLPMDLGIGHYDQAPPPIIDPADLDTMRSEDRFRFANHLAAWIDVEQGEILDAGYSGRGFVGATTAKLGVSVTIPGVSFPLIQEDPVIAGDQVTFAQTAGGRTGAPLPRRIDRPPFIRMTSPTAWTTLSLTIGTEGASTFELKGASPFPRHWIYGADGKVAAKSGLIDFTEWTKVNDHQHSPWHQFDRAVLMSSVESQVERDLSRVVMGRKHKLVEIGEGEELISQGQPGGDLFLILDGMLWVSVDGEEVAELGPGAIVGERAILESGVATATVIAKTKVKAARIPAENMDRNALEQVAMGHRREDD